jgi:hypothetical protein
MTGHRFNAALEKELKYLASIPVGDGGYADHTLRAAAMRAGVAIETLRARMRRP